MSDDKDYPVDMWRGTVCQSATYYAFRRQKVLPKLDDVTPEDMVRSKNSGRALPSQSAPTYSWIKPSALMRDTPIESTRFFNWSILLPPIFWSMASKMSELAARKHSRPHIKLR
mgnify:FL=1